MSTRNRPESGDPMSGVALHAVDDDPSGCPDTEDQAPDLGLRRIQDRFGQIALADSPWFGGIAIQADSLRAEARPHPNMMEEVFRALEGRNPRHKIVGEELQITFDVLGPHERPAVAAVARYLERVFGKVAEFGVFHDADEVGSVSSEAGDAEVVPLVRTDTVARLLDLDR